MQESFRKEINLLRSAPTTTLSAFAQRKCLISVDIRGDISITVLADAPSAISSSIVDVLSRTFVPLTTIRSGMKLIMMAQVPGRARTSFDGNDLE